MRTFVLIPIALVAFVPVANVISQTRAETRAVAVTFDDLPATAVGMVANDVASVTAMTRKLLNAVRGHGVPAVGFVNEGKLFHPGATAGDAEGRMAVLRMWLNAGLELGNHTSSHSRLEPHAARRVPSRRRSRRRGDAEARGCSGHDVPLLPPSVPARGTGHRAAPRFREVSCRARIHGGTGDNGQRRLRLRGRVHDALRQGDAATAARIGDDYLRYMDEVFTFFEGVSRRVLGREIPQVLLLHANTLNADRFDALASALMRRGYRFISLDEALQDKAYRLPDTFVGAPDNSWFNHWEITVRRDPIPTPRPAEWVGRAAQ